MSADWSAVPVPVPYANFADPQSLNLYRYSSNPETQSDPDGHCVVEKQSHNLFWCAIHALGGFQTEAGKKAALQKQGVQAYADISGLDPARITLNGQTPQQFVQGKTAKQLIDADRQIVEFLATQVQFPVQCDAGVSCGIAVPVSVGGPAMDAELAETVEFSKKLLILRGTRRALEILR